MRWMISPIIFKLWSKRWFRPFLWILTGHLQGLFGNAGNWHLFCKIVFLGKCIQKISQSTLDKYTLRWHIKFSTEDVNPIFLQIKLSLFCKTWNRGHFSKTCFKNLGPPLFLFKKSFRRWRSKQRKTYQKNTKFYYFFRSSLKSQ